MNRPAWSQMWASVTPGQGVVIERYVSAVEAEWLVEEGHWHAENARFNLVFDGGDLDELFPWEET